MRVSRLELLLRTWKDRRLATNLNPLGCQHASILRSTATRIRSGVYFVFAMRTPVIATGSSDWESEILLLNYVRV